MTFTSPQTFSESFRCPHCGVHCFFEFLPIIQSVKPPRLIRTLRISRLDDDATISAEELITTYPYEKAGITRCPRCGGLALWIDEKQVWPEQEGTPAHELMPDDVREVYEEAQAIHSKSPRAACAMLRAAAERLIKNIDQNESDTLAQRIKKLDLSPRCIRILEAARLTGNEAVHGNEVDFSESNGEAIARFKALSTGINRVVDELFAQPAEIDEITKQMEDARDKARAIARATKK